METILLTLDPATLAFYKKVALAAGLPTEQVCADALFRLAGELAAGAIKK